MPHGHCGLESLEQTALKSVGKHHTNNIASYRRIIAKAHGRGIRVASGFILGMEGTTDGSYREAVRFFTEVGIVYVKPTYLTFNPASGPKIIMAGAAPSSQKTMATSVGTDSPASMVAISSISATGKTASANSSG